MNPIAEAILFIMQENGQVSADVFREDDETSSAYDPYHRAEMLWESVKDDFPGARHAIYENERAKELKSNTRMEAMGFDPQY